MIVAFALIAGSLGAQALPAVAGKDLLEESQAFPQGLSGSPVVLIVGFSRASSDACEAWHKGLLASPQPGCRIVSLVELEGAPFFVPGLVRQALKKRLPKTVWGDTVLLREGTKALQAALHYDPKAPDAAYGAVLNAQGVILGVFSGPWQPARAYELTPWLHPLKGASK
jgi:hypothetical protein